MDADRSGRPFDVAFCDTCIGGSTVAARLGALASGLQACYLADYRVNPLGVKSALEVRAALESWCAFASARARTLVIACNTASVLLDALPDVRAAADTAGLRVLTMVDLLDRVLAQHTEAVAGRRVCLMGTRFTVGQDAYRRRLLAAGATHIVPLAATQTEQAVARLRHRSGAGRQDIVEEIGAAVRTCDTVVLACTCFPLIADEIQAINPACRLIDPASGLEGLEWDGRPEEENRLTLVVTGNAPDLTLLRQQAPMLFSGWALMETARHRLSETLTVPPSPLRSNRALDR